QILQELQEADEATSALQQTPRGQLRVFCHQNVARGIAPTVSAFLARYPDVTIDLRTADAMIDLIEKGFDVAISPFGPADSTIVRRLLTTLRLKVCCAPSYLETHPAPQHPADLANHSCLLYAYTPGGNLWEFTDAQGTKTSVRIAGRLITTNLETLRAS